MFDLIYNDKRAWELGVAVTTRPSIPTPQLRGSFVQVAGRDGALLESDGTYENITISVELNIVRDPELLNNTYRNIKNWISGSGELSFTDDPDIFFRVKSCSITEYNRVKRKGSKLEASFICDPFSYYQAGKILLPPGEIMNPYYQARPVYYITGEGNATLTVNGNTMKANMGQNLTIDTENMIAYRNDKTLMNTSVTGDYEGLYLEPGINNISITKGFNLTIKPNWRSL